MCDSIAKLPDTKATITGVRTVAEISQLFQPKMMIKVRSDLQQKRKPNYGWLANITTSCRELSSDPSMKGLNNTVKSFLRHLQEVIKMTLRNAKRSQKLKMHVQTFLTYFHTIYWKIKKPFDHSQYKDKMVEIMSMYIDLELKSSMTGKNGLKSLISERICSFLFICLDKSMEHILDAIFKTTKFFLKPYNDICSAVMKRVLHDRPVNDYDVNYVRYLLAYKLWLKIAAKDQSSIIKKQAIMKLIPPSDFHDKLKNGKFTNILPYLPKPDRNRATTFYMQSQFDLKDKIQAFLKHFKSKEGEEDADNSVVILDDLDDASAQKTEPSSEEDILEKIWHQYNDDDLCDDTSFIINDMDTLIHGEDDEYELKKDGSNEGFNNPTVEIESRFRSLARKKYNSPEKRYQLSNFTKTDKVIEDKPLTSDLSKDDNRFALYDKVNDVIRIGEAMPVPVIHGSETVVHHKPCATIGPGQSIETTHAAQSTESADSSGICEQSDEALISNEMFDVVSDEVEIGTGSFDVSSPPLMVNVNSDDTVDRNEAMDGIAESPISNDLTSNTQFVITPEKSQKSILSTHNNNQFNHLLPYVATSEIVSFGRRQDSYSHNELMLHEFIYSDPFPSNGDDNSDEDNRSHALKRYSRGGKLPAFREQTESKCDSGEDFVSSSPSSDRTVADEVYINNSDSTPNVGNFIDNDLKSPTLSPVKDDVGSSQKSSSQGVKRRNSKSLEDRDSSDESGFESINLQPDITEPCSTRSTLKSKALKNKPAAIETKKPTKKTNIKKRRKRRK